MDTGEKRLKKACLLLFLVLASSILSYIILKFISPALLPFFFAWGIAIGLKKPVDFISKKAKIPAKAAAVATVLLTFFAVGYCLFLFVSALGAQAGEIYHKIGDGTNTVTGELSRIVTDLENTVSRIPLVNKLGLFEKSGGASAAGALLTTLLEKLLLYFASFLGKVASSLPYFALFLLVCAISTFYFCTDLSKINKNIAFFFPKQVRSLLFLIKKELFSVVFGYMRAYFLILLMTFFQLFLGLNILGIEYSLLLSALISLVDILPFFGAGIVLLPWGALSVLFGNTRLGVGILVLYVIITVIRQLTEPRILGNTLGLHPLAALASLYIGARLFGIGGIIWFPIFVIVAKNVYCRLREKNQPPGEYSRE